MKVLPVLILLMFFSCQSTQNSKEESILNTHPPNSELPSFVDQILNSNLKGWQLASKSSWGDSIFIMYHTDSSQLNYFIEDYNCDGKQDFAGILKDSLGNYATYKIYSFEDNYIYSQLENYGKQTLLNVGLRFIDSQTPFHHFDGFSETFKCGAIERFNIYNKEKKIFYGNENGFYEIEKGE
ncbi:MAG: hypothetical protein J0L56_05555 [Chitinophagales bacterium]|nr:hypothetical protein [Chitinophagales bacterium]